VIIMAEKKKIYPNPKLKNREEEDKYWATHSPLDEGYIGEIQKEKQNRSSFITIRLTGGELTQLRDLAAAKGMGPSTFIRTLLKDAIEPESRAVLALHERERLYKSLMQGVSDKRKVSGTSTVKEKAEAQYTVSQDAFCILELSKAPIIQQNISDLTTAITLSVFEQIISHACVKLVTSDDIEFTELKRIVKERTGAETK